LSWISPTLPLSPRTADATAGFASARVTGLTIFSGSTISGNVFACAINWSI